MNNEPVAWMDEINTFVLDTDYKQFPKSLQNGMIPLYTHPVKEDAQYDRGFDDGCKHAKKIYEVEIEVLKAELAKYPKQGQSIPCKFTEGM